MNLIKYIHSDGYTGSKAKAGWISHFLIKKNHQLAESPQENSKPYFVQISGVSTSVLSRISQRFPWAKNWRKNKIQEL